jgi:hypothetical protein
MAVSKVPAVIPFDEIVPGATVRFCVKDGVQFLSICDLIMCWCGQDQHNATQIWRQIDPERVSKIGKYLSNFQFPGKDQSEEPVITFVGALKLVMFLPNKAARELRSAMMHILLRYFTGDADLIHDAVCHGTCNRVFVMKWEKRRWGAALVFWIPAEEAWPELCAEAVAGLPVDAWPAAQSQVWSAARKWSELRAEEDAWPAIARGQVLKGERSWSELCAQVAAGLPVDGWPAAQIQVSTSVLD